MSHFIVSMDFGGLSGSPPESNVMPLPTNATVRVASGCMYDSRTSRGGLTDPWPTPMRPPYPPSASAVSSSTSTATPASVATRSASAAGPAGGRSSGAVLTRSRTRLTALAITWPRRTASALPPSVSTVTARSAAGVDRYLRKLYAPSSAPVVTASASSGVSAGSASVTALLAGESSPPPPAFLALAERSAAPAALRRDSASKEALIAGASPSPTASTRVAGSLPPPGILLISSSSPVAPSADSAPARVPPSASSTPASPGAAAGPAGVRITPMTRTSAPAVSGADSLVAMETVTDPMLLHPDVRGRPAFPCRDRRHRVVQRVAGRVTGLHDLLPGGGKHELDELLRLITTWK